MGDVWGYSELRNSCRTAFLTDSADSTKLESFTRGFYICISNPVSQEVIKMFGFKRSVHSVFDIIYNIEIEIVKQKQIFLSSMTNLF